jgi:hypothetical protein
MPDWSREIRAAIGGLNLEPTREAEVVEELSQHLRDRYEELLTSGVRAEQAYQALLKELNDGSLVAGLKATVRAAHPPLSVGRDGDERLFAVSGAICGTVCACCGRIGDSRLWRFFHWLWVSVQTRPSFNCWMRCACVRYR